MIDQEEVKEPVNLAEETKEVIDDVPALVEVKAKTPHKYMPMKKGTSFMQIQLQYEAAVREAASILVCNYSSLNMAIDMGFAGRKQVASDQNTGSFSTRTG